ncbi:MAG: hypothetical protein IJW46_04090 [Clostridia bacterium]|nr:hypothetical protein [Clostridia bacterium]
MKSDTLQNALGAIDPALVARADQMPKRARKRKLRMASLVAAMLALAIGLGAIFGGGSVVPSRYTLAAAIYPTMAPYPKGEWLPGFESRYDAWRDSIKERRAYFGSGKDLGDFFSQTASAFLADSGDDNLVYSPLNVYMALSMLAEVTDTDTRKEILTLLGCDSIEMLRTKANAIWNANYSNDGAVTSILASSLWLSDSLSYNTDTVKTLAETYYASSFSGKMGSAGYDKAFRNWLNEQTGGLLKEYIDELSFTPETLMAMATTVYFQAKWENEFRKSENQDKIFHAPSGDVTCEFMHETEVYGVYYWGDLFSATRKRLEDSGYMWLILPDEGVTFTELLQSEEALLFLSSNGEWENKKTLKVNLAVPKFEVSSKLDLAKGLKALGITSCFDSRRADFSPLFEEDTEVYLSKIEHGATVAIDEEGVIAAAYVAMMMAGGAEPPEDEIDFVLDRPFLFVITGSDGLPLFIGTVNLP